MGWKKLTSQSEYSKPTQRKFKAGLGQGMNLVAKISSGNLLQKNILHNWSQQVSDVRDMSWPVALTLHSLGAASQKN